ncbi:hypothetical protein ACL03H_01215 [Saccharopolyspora sp. MS10]|uniref:hypothetical protein n=1 Tax=Saccharopolyspora sp. MS10 TaxID=3385973 RepID=UPI00399FDA31
MVTWNTVSVLRRIADRRLRARIIEALAGGVGPVGAGRPPLIVEARPGRHLPGSGSGPDAREEIGGGAAPRDVGSPGAGTEPLAAEVFF